MGGRAGWGAGKSWLCGALIATTFAARSPAATQSQLSESVRLFGAQPAAATMPLSLACTASQCAAFSVDVDASNRIAGVLLDAAGAPIEASRVDFGPSSGLLRAVAAEEGFVIAFLDPKAPSGLRVLLLDAATLSVTRDLSTSQAGTNVHALYSDGKTVLLLDFTTDDVATLIDLDSGNVISRQTIADYWEPAVIPGPDQYLLFYANYGNFRRISSLTGAWLGEAEFVMPFLLMSFEPSGYFRDGVYQLIWRNPWSPTGGAGDPRHLLGIRVNAADGKVIETDGEGKPAPQVLCQVCSTVQGAFQIGDANYFWLAPSNGVQALLKMNPATGLRSDPTLTGPDVSIADAPAISVISPLVEPRLLAAEGAVYTADTAHLARFVAGEPQLPGQSSGVKPAPLRATSNGESFLVAWNADHVLRASWLSAKPKPALAIDRVLSQELGFPDLIDFRIASAQGKFLIVGIHENDEHKLDLLWRVMDGSGNLGSLSKEPTTTVLTQWQDAILALGSDGQRYLVALFVGSPEDSDGSIIAQRLSADGAVQEELTNVASSVALLDGVEANFSAPEPERRFAVIYRTAEGNSLPSYARTTSTAGPLAFETTALSPYQYVLANDGHALLLGGAALLDLADRPLTPRAVPSGALSGLSHWDGNAYVRLTNNGALTVNEVSPLSFKVDGEELQLTAQPVQAFSAAAADGQGRSLIAYFAAEAAAHVVELRGALLETKTETVNGQAGAGGDGGSSGEAGIGGESGIDQANLAGARSTAGRSGSAGDPDDDSNGGVTHQGGEAGANSSDKESRACGCALPGVRPSSSSVAALVLLAMAFGRRRRARAARRCATSD